MEDRVISSWQKRFSLLQTRLADEDEEKIKSNSRKFRVYDKISWPREISPLTRIVALENAINNLQQHSIEGVKNHSYLIQQFRQKLEDISLKKQNEMLQEDLHITKCFLEKQNHRVEESIVQNVELIKQVEELSKKNGELQETHVKILQEKATQRMDLESLHADLQVKLSSLAAAKMSLEEETNSLQTELDRRTSVLEDENVNLKGRLRELETALGSLNKDLHCSRAMEEEKEEKIVDLRHQLLENEKAKTCLEQENNSLVSEMKKCRGENSLLQNRIKELESAVQRVNKDLESKVVRLLELTERQSSQMESNLIENGKPKCLHENESESENGKENVVHEKSKPNGEMDEKTPAKAVGERKTEAKPMSEKRNAKQVVKERTPKQVGGKISNAREIPWRRRGIYEHST